MNWNDFFTYDDGNLIWNKDVGRKIRKGTTAGTLTPRGYVTVTLQGKKYRAHRIIWEMLKGPVPFGMEIDHDDGIRSNNRIGNLKLCTNAGNHKNMAKRSDNTSGTTGVAFIKATGRWRASIKVNGVATNQHFDTEVEAINAREQLSILHGFSRRHGT